MDFTLAVLEHYLKSNDVRIANEPKNLDRTFRIACAPEGLPQTSASLAIYPSGTITRGMEASIPVMFVCPTDEAGKSAAKEHPEAFVVVSGKSPSWLAENVNLYLSRVSAWVEEMDGIIESGGNAEALLESSEKILGHYLGATDALYRRVATTPHIAPIERFSRELVETGQYPPDGIREIEALASRERWDEQLRTVVSQSGNAINPFPNASRVYRLRGHYAAHLVMVSEEKIDKGELFLFDLLADKLGALLNKLWRERDPYAQPYTRFLERALSSPVHDRAYFVEQATRFSFPTQGVFEICAIAGAQDHGGLNHLAHQIHLALPDSWALIRDARIYVLLHAPEHAEGEIASAEQQLFEFVGRLESEIGVSDRFESLEYAYLGRLEADIALQSGHKNVSIYEALESVEPDLFTVFRFKRYLPCYLVDPTTDASEFIAQFEKSSHPIIKMREADRKNGTHDYSLLRVYLYFDSNAKRTAELMHMHRNTVDYRLRKIRDFYHIDLDDDDTRLLLHYLFGVLD